MPPPCNQCVSQVVPDMHPPPATSRKVKLSQSWTPPPCNHLQRQALPAPEPHPPPLPPRPGVVGGGMEGVGGVAGRGQTRGDLGGDQGWGVWGISPNLTLLTYSIGPS